MQRRILGVIRGWVGFVLSQVPKSEGHGAPIICGRLTSLRRHLGHPPPVICRKLTLLPRTGATGPATGVDQNAAEDGGVIDVDLKRAA